MEKETQFKKELFDLLQKHHIRLSLICYDMAAYLTYHTYHTDDSVDNLICKCSEGLHEETIVNDYLL